MIYDDIIFYPICIKNSDISQFQFVPVQNLLQSLKSLQFCMITLEECEQDQDLKPPQFFHLAIQDNLSNATKVLEFTVNFLLRNNQLIKGQLLLYEEYIAARIDKKMFISEVDLTITFIAKPEQRKLILKDDQRELQLTVFFIQFKDYEGFYDQIKKCLFQTNFEQKYQIIEKLGSGKTSVVYRIKSKGNGLIYAAKFYSNIPASIKRQIKILKQLQHPNLIYFQQMFLNNGQVYLIMDQQDGGTLLDKIQQKQFLTMKQKIKFLIDMLNAFQFLRIKDIVHRDLKPENILYSKKDGCYKIADFELAIHQNQSLTRLVGTPGYIAPQLFESQKQIISNQYSDIYTLGLIYYQLATKKTYFRGSSKQQLIKNNKKAKSLKRKKYSKQQISDLQYDILRMMIRAEPQKRKLSLEILQSPQLRKMVKQYALGKLSSTLSSSSSSSKNKKQRKNSVYSQFTQSNQEQNFMQAMKNLLRLRSSL